MATRPATSVMSLAVQIGQFLDLHPEDSFSAFTIAAHIKASRLSVATILARMANERKIRKRERGFYSTAKSPANEPGFSTTGELNL